MYDFKINFKFLKIKINISKIVFNKIFKLFNYFILWFKLVNEDFKNMVIIKIVIKILVKLLLGILKRWFNLLLICIIFKLIDVVIFMMVVIIVNILIIFLKGCL